MIKGVSGFTSNMILAKGPFSLYVVLWSGF